MRFIFVPWVSFGLGTTVASFVGCGGTVVSPGSGGAVVTTETMSVSATTTISTQTTSLNGGGGAGGGGQGGSACQQCTDQNCPSQTGACQQEPSMGCQSWLQCVAACNQQPMPTSSCFTTCDAVNGGSKSLYEAIYACSCMNCKVECASSDPCGTH